jgi:hypothetical protein
MNESDIVPSKATDATSFLKMLHLCDGFGVKARYDVRRAWDMSRLSGRESESQREDDRFNSNKRTKSSFHFCFSPTRRSQRHVGGPTSGI